jgi:hypothetical protein
MRRIVRKRRVIRVGRRRSSSAGGVVGVLFVLFLIVGACNATGSSNEPTAATPTAVPAPTSAAPVQPASLCETANSYPSQTNGPYDGSPGCRPGETVTIAHFIDAATYELTDGRKVRLAGVVVRGPHTCGGAAALTETRGQFTEGQQVNMLKEPGAGTDQFGSQWVYVEGDQGNWGQDLGMQLASAGFADALSNSGANSAYVDAIAGVLYFSKLNGNGQWGPPCGPAAPGDTNAGSGSDTTPEVDVDTDHHHHNMPDGLLTGGFCRHHRWC